MFNVVNELLSKFSEEEKAHLLKEAKAVSTAISDLSGHDYKKAIIICYYALMNFVKEEELINFIIKTNRVN